jgi:hypothetical protein
MNDKSGRQDGDGLLPCPFCGGAPHERWEDNQNGPKYPGHHFVWCENLDCRASPETMEETAAESRKAWNTRPQSQGAAPSAAPCVDPDLDKAGNRRYWADRQAASPNPAPDAMRSPTEAMLNAARDWSVAKYGRGIGNDAAIGCWQAMWDAAPVPPADGAHRKAFYSILSRSIPSDMIDSIWQDLKEAGVAP